VEEIEYAAMYCEGEPDGDEPEEGNNLFEQEAESLMRTLRRLFCRARLLLNELYSAEEQQVRANGLQAELLRNDELRDTLNVGAACCRCYASLDPNLLCISSDYCQLLVGHQDEGSIAANELALSSTALGADFQTPRNSIVVSMWAIEYMRANRELVDRAERQLQGLTEDRSKRKVLARNNARKLLEDRDREIRSAKLSMAAMSEQKMVHNM